MDEATQPRKRKMELARYDGHLFLWANQGAVSWREAEGGIRPSTRSKSSSWRGPGVARAAGARVRAFGADDPQLGQQADLDEGRRSDGLTTEVRLELLRLKRENKRLKREREISRKAAAQFARESGSIPGGDNRSHIRHHQPQEPTVHEKRDRSRSTHGKSFPFLSLRLTAVHVLVTTRPITSPISQSHTREREATITHGWL